MDPTAIITLMTPTIVEAAKILAGKTKKRLASQAKIIIKENPESQDSVRNLFNKTKERLASAWYLGMFMTVTLFVLFVGMAITSVVTGIIFDKPMYSAVFGGVSAASLFTVIIWKPYEMMFRATITIQRLEMVVVGLEEEWSASAKIVNVEDRMARIREANQAALSEMAKITS